MGGWRDERERQDVLHAAQLEAEADLGSSAAILRSLHARYCNPYVVARGLQRRHQDACTHPAPSASVYKLK